MGDTVPAVLAKLSATSCPLNDSDVLRQQISPSLREEQRRKSTGERQS